MRFTTYRYDPVLGKHFALARFYDGVNGRMMSKDPVKRGLNPYCYCDNDPVNYEDSTGEVLHILGAAGVGGLLGAGAAALDSIVSQALNGEKIDWREVGGAAVEGGIIGATQAALITSGAGAGASFIINILGGAAGSAAEQYINDGKIGAWESLGKGFINAVGQLPYNDKIFDKLGKLKNLQGAGREAVKGAMAGAGEAGTRYLFDHIGSDPAQVRMGTGLLPAIAGNFTPRELLRDPKRGCGSESPFTPGLGYHSARGYRYDVPRISESRSNKASLGGFLKETALGGLMGGLASAAFYKLDKGLEKLKESVFRLDNKDLYSALSLNLGEPDDNVIIDAMKRVGSSTPEEFRVFGHGNSKGIQYKDQILNAEQVAKLIKNSPQYIGGDQKVKLYSCETGKHTNGFAQQLADNLQTVVEAPNGILYTTKTGEFDIVNKRPWSQNSYRHGSWVEYRPKKYY